MNNIQITKSVLLTAYYLPLTAYRLLLPKISYCLFLRSN